MDDKQNVRNFFNISVHAVPRANCLAFAGQIWPAGR